MFLMKRVCALAAIACLATIASAATEHKTLPLGAEAPDFSLPGVDGKTYHLADFSSAKVLAIVFTCNHCATAQAYEDRLMQLANDYKDKGVALVAICSNDPLALRLDELNFSDVSDSLEDMKIRAKDRGFNFPYLYDGDTQSVAQAYGPIATPHIFIFDQQRKLRYQGRIDNSEIHTVTQQDARNAIDALLADKPVPVETTRVFGCTTKWAEKRQGAVDSIKKWDAESVSLNSIDDDAVKKLVANGSKNLVLVNLWATWCGPCVQEMPDLVTINRMYRDREFQFVTISIDDPANKSQALAMLQKLHVAATNYIYNATDLDKLAAALDPKWPGPVPYTLLIAPGGKIIYRHDGAIDPLEVKRTIVNYLGRTAAGRAGKVTP